MTKNPISELLQDARANLARAEANIEEKRDLFQDAEKRLSASQATYMAYKEAYDIFESNDKKPKRKRAPRAPSSATPETKNLFNAIYAHYGSSEFGYDGILNIGDRNGLDVNPTNIRSSMSDYVRAGHVERPAPGRFKIKESGMSFFGISEVPPPMKMPLGIAETRSKVAEALKRIERANQPIRGGHYDS